MNHSLSRSLSTRAPYTVHTGQHAANPMTVASAESKKQKVRNIDVVRTLQNLNIQMLHDALDDMQKHIGEKLDSTRRKAIELHNAKRHILSCKPIVGYYVLVSRILGSRTKTSTN